MHQVTQNPIETKDNKSTSDQTNKLAAQAAGADPLR